MTAKIIWSIYCLITVSLFIFLLTSTPPAPAGDIVEYYGITESLINHQGINLTREDQQNLSITLHPEYFQDPGYYIMGSDGNRYPVHFILYSILAVPARLFLRLFNLPELHTLTLLNTLILSTAVFVIIKRFLKSSLQKIIFLLAIYLSPLVFFLTWPGPDLYYLSLLLLAIFFFFDKQYAISAILAIFASWHSQPLMVLAVSMIAYYIFSRKFNINPVVVATVLAMFLLLVIPYLFNLAVFGTFTPWTILEDGWTKLYGFGLQNVSLQKLFEQFFDLNMGLFWYAPVILILGLFFFVNSSFRNQQSLFILAIVLVTAFFYQTNPAWHYGTAGFGPSRHAVFMLPFFLFGFISLMRPAFRYFIILIIFTLSQIIILWSNGFLTPKFQNTLYHTPLAQLVLNNKPSLYSPTGEIFVDRTNHTDLKYPSSAIYKYKGVCKKAYMLKTDIDLLEKECGIILSDIEKKLDRGEGFYVDF